MKDAAKTSYKRTAFHEHIYWREISRGYWHCYQREYRNKGAFVSLCGMHTRKTAGGQALTRPISEFRCGRCDGLEMDLLGAEESLPASREKA